MALATSSRSVCAELDPGKKIGVGRCDNTLAPGLRFRLTDDIGEYQIPVGTGCAAVYAEQRQPVRIIRRVIIRMHAWMKHLRENSAEQR